MLCTDDEAAVGADRHRARRRRASSSVLPSVRSMPLPRPRCRVSPRTVARAPRWWSAGEGWHPGVVGIVASRLVERHHRPVVVLSLDEEGKRQGMWSCAGWIRPPRCLKACAEAGWCTSGGIRRRLGFELRRRSWRRSARRSRPTPTRAVLGGDLRRTTSRWTPWSARRRPRPRGSRATGPARPVRAGQSRRSSCSSRGRRWATMRTMGADGNSTLASTSPVAPRRPARWRLQGRSHDRGRAGGSPLDLAVQARGQPLERRGQ